ncbi:MAG: MGDG synthase family glycosyltransferase [Erysipelotrichaceae bacterium]
MKTLILSCNFGQGHNSAGQAIKEYYESQNVECDMLDALSFINDFFSDFLSKSHVSICNHAPFIFDKGYKLAENNQKFFKEDSLILKLISKKCEDLYYYIVDNYYSQVICTHVFAGMMITKIKNDFDLKCKTSFVFTDYTCHPGSKYLNVDYFFVPCDYINEELQYLGIDDDKIITSGIPVKGKFYQNFDLRDDGKKNILISTGSLGGGPLKKVITALLNDVKDGYIKVVCGKNEKIRKKLQKEFEDNPRVEVLGYISNIDKLMDKSDIFITKPGGISTTEAVNKILPMLFIDIIGACEDYNKQYFVDLGCAKTFDDIEQLSKECYNLLNNPDEYNEIMKNLKVIKKYNSAKIIFEAMAG